MHLFVCNPGVGSMDWNVPALLLHQPTPVLACPSACSASTTLQEECLGSTMFMFQLLFKRVRCAMSEGKAAWNAASSQDECDSCRQTHPMGEAHPPRMLA